MCGICGLVSRARAPERELLLRMMGRLAHRGPDSSGYYRDEVAALGHRRLAIIDAEGGAQPLSNEDGRIWITFNGEIFNYVELAAELGALGHRFSTCSDTEVIVHAWEEWGAGCFSKFNGQWALAIWDRLKGELVLSRDPAGILPLYYAFSGGKFLFASEIKAIFADPAVPRAFDPQGLGETFSFWCAVAPRTPYLGISELEPGHWAVLKGEELKSSAYWGPRFPAAGGEEGQDIVENGRRLKEGLIEATRLRFLRSDVPVGAYLSGGIDSSVTAAIISRYTDAPLKTFSLRFTDREFDEGPYQSEMARRLGTDHLCVEVSAPDIAEAFPEALWHAEKPILRSGPVPMFLLSRFVRGAGYKVVVTGEGSDEILAGYDIFRETQVRAFLARDPSSAKRGRVAELLYPWMLRSPGKAPSFASAFFGGDLDPKDPALSHRPRWNSTETISRILLPEFREKLRAFPRPDEALIARMPAGHEGWDPISRAQWLECSTLLPGYILSSQGDRMLMANSVEGRFPFLDRGLIDLANSFPARHKLFGLDEKHILKREFADLLPDSILRRPKQPYRAPDASCFFSGAALDWMDEAVSERTIGEAGVFDNSSVRALFAKCEAVRGQNMSNTDNMRVLAVISTQLAHLQFIRGDGSGPNAAEAPEPSLGIDMLMGNKRGGCHDAR